MSFRKVWQVIALITIIAMVIGACSSGQTSTTVPSSESPAAVVEPTKAPLKVALLTTGPLADSGWNATAYQGLLDAQKEFGIEPAVSEDVPAPDREQTIRDYASQGYSLIIGHDFSFMDPMVKILPSTLVPILAIRPDIQEPLIWLHTICSKFKATI
jgi:basic membrane protein A